VSQPRDGLAPATAAQDAARSTAVLRGEFPLDRYTEVPRPWGANWSVTGPDRTAWTLQWTRVVGEVIAFHGHHPAAYRERAATVEKARQQVVRIAARIDGAGTA